MGVEEHKKYSGDVGVVRCAILVISDTKTFDTDTSGKLAQEVLEKDGNEVKLRSIIRNDVEVVRKEISVLLSENIDLIVTIGGTGISKKDLSIEAVREFLDKELDGFGELFRSMSVKEIGTAAIMSRALLGTSNGKVILCIPGSTAAVRLAIEDILLPELKHILWELRRYA
ncbi:MAG: molybdenum cofactor biosynthesis protein [Planctomycetes bacterium RBG_16_43_13]|nr:MAG: molybdenum cofactor biosynthesis protein [Planctomycetes bacterium RBG_16_43_13]